MMYVGVLSRLLLAVIGGGAENSNSEIDSFLTSWSTISGSSIRTLADYLLVPALPPVQEEETTSNDRWNNSSSNNNASATLSDDDDNGRNTTKTTTRVLLSDEDEVEFSEKDAVCYAERYGNLLKGYCGGGSPDKCDHRALRSHYRNHGKAERLIWGCSENFLDADGRKAAACYAQRYVNLLGGYCKGNDAKKCDHLGLYFHYKHHGRAEQLVWGCRGRSLVPAKPVADQLPFLSQRSSHRRLKENKLHILVFETVASRVPDTVLLQQAADHAGIYTTVFGTGTEFEGFGTKWQVILPVLADLPSNELVVIADGRDVILNIHSKDETNGQDVLAGFSAAYDALTYDKPGAVVMSAEGQCCVAALTYCKPGDYFNSTTGRRSQRACPSGDPGCRWAGDSHRLPWEDMMIDIARKATGGQDVYDVYLNAGLVTGRRDDLIKLLRVADMEVYEDDQAVFTDVLYSQRDVIVLDYAQVIYYDSKLVVVA